MNLRGRLGALAERDFRLVFSSTVGLGTWMLAFLAPFPVLLAAQVIAGTGLAIHLALWFTVFQQQVPEHARARVSSYDALGSFILIPIGTAVVGPRIGAGIVVQAMNLLVLAQPEVWQIREKTA